LIADWGGEGERETAQRPTRLEGGTKKKKNKKKTEIDLCEVEGKGEKERSDIGPPPLGPQKGDVRQDRLAIWGKKRDPPQLMKRRRKEESSTFKVRQR